MRVLFFLLLAACGPVAANTDDAASDANDTQTPVTGAESDCADTLDDDGDGQVDCDDDDCAAVWPCSLPDQINHQTTIDFEGYEVECDLGAFPIQYTVGDCVTRFTADLQVTDQGSLCPDCDRTYAAPIVYVEDNCDELTGDNNRPDAVRFGFVFLSEDERELWSFDENETWVYSINLVRDGDQWAHSDGGVFETSVDECQNSPLALGYLTVSLEFSDAP